MAQQVGMADLLNLLESSDLQTVGEIEKLIKENLESSREAWLLNCLVDSYMVSQSKKCMEVLLTVREPHDKHILDKLAEHSKNPAHRVQALTLFSYIVKAQPPWLHSVIKHPFFANIIKCLKTDTDVPNLMSALLIVSALLPIIQVSMASHLNDIFEVFVRLIDFSAKHPANTPDVYLLHLQVGVYSLFHQLYGMYPCHFLTYLRTVYGKPENTRQFEKFIKPLLETVRMHPLLVTSTKDKEVSKSRWRQKEVHDIMVECAKVSLDITVGIGENPKLPFIRNIWEHLPEDEIKLRQKEYLDKIKEYDNPPQVKMQASTPLHPKPGTTVSTSDSSFKPDITLSFTVPSLSSSTIDSTAIWSPSSVCGLATPPPTAPGASGTTSLTDLSSQQGTIPNTPLRTTPHMSVPESPLLASNEEPDKKRLSWTGMPHVIHQELLGSPSCGYDSSVGGSVPVSPLKPDFTSEPPINVQRMHAIRKITFGSPDHSQPSGAAASPAVGALQLPDSKKLKSPESQQVEQHPSKSQPESFPMTIGEGPDSLDRIDECPSGTPTIAQLPQLIDSLHTADKALEEDKEVSEINQDAIIADSDSESESEMPQQQQAMTAESVAAFMKNVNRIRFNSMNLAKEKPRERFKATRSYSCPSLDDSVEMETHKPISVQNSSTPTKEDKLETIPQHPDELDGPTTDSTSGTDLPPDASVEKQERQTVNIDPKFFPYRQLIIANLENCHFCGSHLGADKVAATGKVQDSGSLCGRDTPLFAAFTPPDLLDRHIALGGDTHAKELHHIPMPSQKDISWTHFGGVPPADEIQILRGQILLLHNQLIFERHKRELHSKRNRSLLKRIVKVSALEENNEALRDQLKLQETEVQNLKISLKLEQQKFEDLKKLHDTFVEERDTQDKNNQNSIDLLKEEKEKLENTLHVRKQENNGLIQELQSVKRDNYNLNQEVNSIRLEVNRTNDLKDQVCRLNTELLLMGELQQMYQQRLVVMNKGNCTKAETTFLVESYKMENNHTKASMETKIVQLDAARAKLLDLEEQLKTKDTMLNDLKKLLEDTKAINKREMDAIKDAFAAQKKIQVALSGHIAELEIKNMQATKTVEVPPREAGSGEAVDLGFLQPLPLSTSESSALTLDHGEHVPVRRTLTGGEPSISEGPPQLFSSTENQNDEEELNYNNSQT